MTIEVLKSKIHRAQVTGADLNYIGSITIDRRLMTAAGLIEGEKVHVVNLDNGQRLVTYVIPGEEGKGDIVLNGPAAHLVKKGDLVIIMAYAAMSPEEARDFNPAIVFPSQPGNRI